MDWFSAAEIWIELGLAITGFWIFAVHLATGRDTFIDPRIFTDRNFVTGLVFIFVIGIILLASLALLPPMLSRIFDYPTIEAIAVHLDQRLFAADAPLPAAPRASRAPEAAPLSPEAVAALSDDEIERLLDERARNP